MERMTTFRSLCAVAVGIVTAVISPLFLPIAVLIVLNLIDYVTAIIASRINGEAIRSDIGIRGIYKKVMMWITAGTAVMVDVLLSYGAQAFGLPAFTSMYISIVCVMWLCVNEVISVLENVAKFGDNVPPVFYGVILALQKWLKGDDDNDNTTVSTKHGNKSV